MCPSNKMCRRIFFFFSAFKDTGSEGWPTWNVDFDFLGELALQGGSGCRQPLGSVAGLYKLAACRSQQQTLCPVGLSVSSLTTYILITVSRSFLWPHGSITHSNLRVCWGAHAHPEKNNPLLSPLIERNCPPAGAHNMI